MENHQFYSKQMIYDEVAMGLAIASIHGIPLQRYIKAALYAELRPGGDIAIAKGVWQAVEGHVSNLEQWLRIAKPIWARNGLKTWRTLFEGEEAVFKSTNGDWDLHNTHQRAFSVLCRLGKNKTAEDKRKKFEMV